MLNELKRLCKLATPGPWAIRFEDPGSQYATAWVGEDKEMTFEDCTFMEQARDAMPKLISCLELSFEEMKHHDAEDYEHFCERIKEILETK